MIVADTYAAGEAPIVGADRDSLISGIKARDTAMRCRWRGPDQLAPMVADLAGPGDYVVFLGAGNITQWAYALPGELASFPSPSGEKVAARSADG